MDRDRSALVHRIADGVEDIDRTIGDLRDLRDMSLEEYRSEEHDLTRAAVERKFETLTAASVDVAKAVLRLESTEVPTHRKAVFRELESLGVLEAELTARLEEAVAFRDVLAHSYGPIINDELVYDAMQHSLDRYVEFVEAIDSYLSES